MANGGVTEPNTDPRFIYADDSNVIAYRLGILESDVSGIDVKLDRIINEYPTHSTLSLILDPMREELKELKGRVEKEKEDKIKNGQQIKYLMIAAIAGPLATFIITLVMAYMIGGVPDGPNK